MQSWFVSSHSEKDGQKNHRPQSQILVASWGHHVCTIRPSFCPQNVWKVCQKEAFPIFSPQARMLCRMQLGMGTVVSSYIYIFSLFAENTYINFHLFK